MENTEKLLIKSYISDLLKNQVSYFENQIEGLLYDGNIEYLHHTRVMVRRIRTTITTFSPYLGKKISKKWLSSLKNLTKLLTRVRDLDVQIQFLQDEISKVSEQRLLAGLLRLQLRKQQKRDKKQFDVRQAIINFEKQQTIFEIKEFIEKHPFDSENFKVPDKLHQIGSETIERLTKKCFSYVPFITDPIQSEALHNLRISLKNLRYSVELFQPIYPTLDTHLSIFKKFQDDLGEIHDYDVWLDDLNQFLDDEKQKITEFYGQSGPFNFIKPGILFLIEDIKLRKSERHEKFLERWNDQFQNQFWNNLKSVFDYLPPAEETKAA